VPKSRSSKRDWQLPKNNEAWAFAQASLFFGNDTEIAQPEQIYASGRTPVQFNPWMILKP
jgi:hypothetical protein